MKRVFSALLWLGLGAGIGMLTYFCSAAMLVPFGLALVAVIWGWVLGLLIWAVATPTFYCVTRGTATFRPAMYLLAGAGALLLYGVIDSLIRFPGYFGLS